MWRGVDLRRAFPHETRSFKMTTMIMEGDGELLGPEFSFYMKGNPSLDKAKRSRPYEWISEGGWKDLELLATLDKSLANLTEDIVKNRDAWREWYSNSWIPRGNLLGAGLAANVLGNLVAQGPMECPLGILRPIAFQRYDKETPETEMLPCGYDEVDPFKQMLIIRCFRPDRLINATKNFIIWKLYDYFV